MRLAGKKQIGLRITDSVLKYRVRARAENEEKRPQRGAEGGFQNRFHTMGRRLFYGFDLA
jgi:hypothetical protein